MHPYCLYRMGKMCRRCLGPMEEFAPGDLLSQAAVQMSENLMTEVRTTGTLHFDLSVGLHTVQ